MGGARTYGVWIAALLLVTVTGAAVCGCSVTPAIDAAPAEEAPRSPGGFAADSPEGAVDAYVAALVAEDVEAMWALHAGRVWPAGDPVTYDEFAAAAREVTARYRAAGVPDDVPCFGGYTVSARTRLRGAEYDTGEAVREAYRVAVVVQAYEIRDSMRGYRSKPASFVALWEGERWVVTNADSALP